MSKLKITTSLVLPKILKQNNDHRAYNLRINYNISKRHKKCVVINFN